jgi:hypothetical protein
MGKERGDGFGPEKWVLRKARSEFRVFERDLSIKHQSIMIGASSATEALSSRSTHRAPGIRIRTAYGHFRTPRVASSHTCSINAFLDECDTFKLAFLPLVPPNLETWGNS